MRIWYQSCTTIGSEEKWAAYQRALQDHIKTVVREDTEVHIHGTKVYTPAIDRYFFLEYFNTHSIIENAIRAQKEEFDVFALGCFLDSGFFEIQEAVDIPVAFSCQAALHVASILARRFLVVVPNQGLQVRVLERARFFGLHNRITACKVRPFEHEKLQIAINDIDAIWTEVEELVEGDSEAELLVPG